MQFNYRVTFRTSQVTITHQCAFPSALLVVLTQCKLLLMHGRRNLRDFYRSIKDLTKSQVLLLKDIFLVSHLLHSARHVKVTQLRAHSSSR